MDENVYTTNVERKEKKGYSRGFKVLLRLGIFLTGLQSLVGIFYIILGIRKQVWLEVGMCGYVRQVFYFLCILCCFVSIIKIASSQKSFSKLVVQCMRIVGSLIMVSAFLLPQLQGYKNSGFEIVSYGKFMLADGNILILGIILLIFAGIIKQRFSMQNEIDEIL